MAEPLRRDLAALRDPFDVVVIGAGITGVHVARECAGRGWRTLVVDKDDFGAGTSSATTKYIHGGLRYLEQGDFAVVRQSVRERRVLTLAAPHLVAPRRFLLPAWTWARPGRLRLAAGVGLYELLAADRNRGVDAALRVPRARWLGREAVTRAVPWLWPAGLQGAFAYYDVLNLHPERLLLALLRSAVELGAVALNHAPVVGFLTEGVPGRADDGVVVRGVVVRDTPTGVEHAVRARAVVNAAGPWADLALGSLAGRVGVSVRRVKGVHLLTRALGGRDALFTRTRDGRHIVVSPWMGKSFIGPTESETAEEPDRTAVTESDVAEIVRAVNDVSRVPLREDDIEGATVGVRPIVYDPQADTYSSSRRFEVHDHASRGVHGLWSVVGGKWTTGRAVGAAVATRLAATGGLPRPRPFDSRGLPVAGAYGDRAGVAEMLAAARSNDAESGLTAEVRGHLARLYGRDHVDVVALAAERRELARRVSDIPGRLDIAAQAAYAVTHEAALTLADVLDRRLVLGTLGRLADHEVRRVAAVVGPLLGWDERRVAEESAAEIARRDGLARVLAAGTARPR